MEFDVAYSEQMPLMFAAWQSERRAPRAHLEPLQLGEVAEAAGDRPREVVCVESEDCELAQRAELDRNGAGEVVVWELGGEVRKQESGAGIL